MTYAWFAGESTATKGECGGDQGRVMRISLILLGLAVLCACTRMQGPATVADLETVGAQLFSDPRLSADGAVSCATCHDPERVFTDGKQVSLGVFGRQGTRNAPSLLDLDLFDTFFWDGRETSLDVVVLQPFTNPTELGHDDLQAVLDTLHSIPEYRAGFAAALGRERPDAGDLAGALAAFLNSVERGESRYERFLATGDPSILTKDEHAGLALFRGKAQCGECHTPDLGAFADNRFHHAGIGFERVAGNLAPLLARIDRLESEGEPLGRLVLQDADIAELGRFVATRRPRDLGAFRTPTLRNVANTAPYMHDGSVTTLEEAIERELYYRGISLGRPINLTVEERHQLAAFLRALSIE